ncbi:MAG: sulfotransferase, partial [Anaerolineales bacterium]
VYNNQEHSRHRLFYGGAAGAKTNFRQPTGQMRPQNSGNGHLADVVTRQFERALAADAYRASYNGQMVDKIDFLVIGAEKCGTTWLADMLRQHPEVFIPPEKELFYFNRQFFESPELENFNHAKPLSWYFAFFKNAAPEQVKGEVCVAYIWDEAAPQKIQAFNPGIKIIAILRDPVERAFSQYLYYIQRGVLGDVSFEQAIEMRPDLLSRSLYAGQLQRYYERFPPENIRVTFFDDLKADNRAFLQTIEAFLGISEFIPPDIDSRANVTGTPRYQWLNRAMSRVRYWVRKYDPPFLLDFLRFTGLAQFSEVLRLKNTRPAEGRPVIDPETEARLRAYFREDMEKLEKLTGRDHPLASCSRLRTTIVSSPMPTA